jgi:predicted small lipoprotein YifL
MTSIITRSLLVGLLALTTTTACGKKSEGEAAPADKAATAAKPVADQPAPAAAGGDVDLSPGGVAWKGLTLKGPADSKVTDNGAGGVGVVMGNFAFEINPTEDLKLRKDGIKSGLEFSKGTVTYQVDTADEIAYTTETPNADGAKIKGYGFAMAVTVAGKKLYCNAMLDDEGQVAAAKTACKSLAKK